MNEDHALYCGSIAIGGSLIAAQLVAGGAVGTSATIGICMVPLAIRGLRSVYKLPSARVVRTR